MSIECIVDLGDVKRKSWKFQNLFEESIPLKGRLVRCRNCKYGEHVYWPAGSDIPPRYLNCAGPLVETWDYQLDKPKDNPVRPDGFCAWGVEKKPKPNGKTYFKVDIQREGLHEGAYERLQKALRSVDMRYLADVAWMQIQTEEEDTMAKADGRMVTCDVCKTSKFLKRITTEKIADGIADGEYSKWDMFEKLEPGWEFNKFGYDHICPRCAKSFKDAVEKAARTIRSGGVEIS